MKKITFLLTILLFISGFSVTAQNPIPSWNVPIYYVANFQEAVKDSKVPSATKGKRTMYIKAKSTDGQGSCQAQVWIYSLDLQDIYGPFTVLCGQTISQEIDEREWGVYVESEDHVYVDVWIDEGNLLKYGNQVIIPEESVLQPETGGFSGQSLGQADILLPFRIEE